MRNIWRITIASDISRVNTFMSYNVWELWTVSANRIQLRFWDYIGRMALLRAMAVPYFRPYRTS